MIEFLSDRQQEYTAKMYELNRRLADELRELDLRKLELTNKFQDDLDALIKEYKDVIESRKE